MPNRHRLYKPTCQCGECSNLSLGDSSYTIWMCSKCGNINVSRIVNGELRTHKANTKELAEYRAQHPESTDKSVDKTLE